MLSNVDFYKDMYFKELELRHKLDEKIMIPIGILSLLVTVQIYIFTRHFHGISLFLLEFFSILFAIAMVSTLYFLGKSFMNLGKAYMYSEIASMNDYLKYEDELNDSESKELIFNRELKQAFADSCTINRQINLKRTSDLASAKIALFVTVVCTFINATIFASTIFFR